jgi:hypothetical protein
MCSTRRFPPAATRAVSFDTNRAAVDTSSIIVQPRRTGRVQRASPAFTDVKTVE